MEDLQISLNSTGTNLINDVITNAAIEFDVKVKLILGAYVSSKTYPLLFEENLTVIGLS